MLPLQSPERDRHPGESLWNSPFAKNTHVCEETWPETSRSATPAGGVCLFTGGTRWWCEIQVVWGSLAPLPGGVDVPSDLDGWRVADDRIFQLTYGSKARVHLTCIVLWTQEGMGWAENVPVGSPERHIIWEVKREPFFRLCLIHSVACTLGEKNWWKNGLLQQTQCSDTGRPKTEVNLCSVNRLWLLTEGAIPFHLVQ